MNHDAARRAIPSRWRSKLALSVLVISGALLSSVPSPTQEPDFDHTATRFLLTGSHENVRCEACHIAGVFRGTPTDCAFCHDGTGMRAESGKPLNHVPTSNRCEDCHTTVTWEEVRFDHSAVTGSCSSCHNGFVARGKSSGHILTSADCNVCHIDVAWDTIRFDHSAVTGPCSSCHNGIEAGGLPNGHILTSSECDLCHSTGAWRPASFDHSGVTGSCSSCHNGINATGTPNGHFMSNSDCDACHTADRWTPNTFRHMSANYPGDHRDNLACTQCHMANNEAVQWPFSSLQPDCAACHHSDFRSGPHKKSENPDTFYTPEELRDCSGSCHTYTDATLTTIKDLRNAEHRVSDGSF